MHLECKEVYEDGRLILRIETRLFGGYPIFIRAVGPNADCIDDKSILDTNDVYVYGRNLDNALDGILERLIARSLELPEQPSLVLAEQIKAA